MGINEVLELFEQHELGNALEALNGLILKDNDNVQALNLRGRIYYKMQKWGDAMNDYATVLEIDPHNQEAKAGWEMTRNILGYFNPDMFNP
ncbi:MAG: tetratricopeptide repeat protein [Prolixibacteraceae bacterium]|nr:tetratricopeptide repeat protein [Prolixibacteraceae bacterium]